MISAGMSSIAGTRSGARRFSRCRISIWAPSVSTTSTSKRPPRASVSTRCATFSPLARHRLTLMPYFFSNASVSGRESTSCIEV
jgi:hypothetical protein